jgi:hypothetical protein
MDSTQYYYTTIFNKSNIILLLWFLAIYSILYLLLHISQVSFLSIGRLFDLVIFGLIVLYIVLIYALTPISQKEQALENAGNKYLTYLNDPLSILSLSLFLAVFYLVIFLFQIPMTADKSLVVSIVESLAWITMAFLIITDFFRYVVGVNIIEPIQEWFASLWGKLPTTEDGTPSVTDASGNEVFHISNNLYTYDDAQAICSAYGAQLATYDQINDYYNRGGEFCGYGWSANQLALFPTQESTWNELQKNDKTKNVCGRMGINGGAFDSSYKFGVNCFGKKPAPTASDLAHAPMPVIPKTPEQMALEEKVKFYRDHSNNLLNISRFNGTQWSEYSR